MDVAPKDERSVYDFPKYREYLLFKVGPTTQRRGVKSAIAKALNCQPTFVSQVLSGRSEFSLEQGELVSRFFGHTADETRFFLLLIQRDRAGTSPLKKLFDDQIAEQLSKRMTLTRRLGQVNPLSDEQRSRYYSSWLYSAVHIALTIPELRTRTSIADHLGISRDAVGKVLEFLLAAGLAEKKGEQFLAKSAQIRLGNDSHLIVKHHTNWRIRAVQSLDEEDLSELHYSSVFSVARSDAAQIKDMLLEVIKTFAAKVKDSREEELYSFTMDLFKVKSTSEPLTPETSRY